MMLSAAPGCGFLAGFRSARPDIPEWNENKTNVEVMRCDRFSQHAKLQNRRLRSGGDPVIVRRHHKPDGETLLQRFSCRKDVWGAATVNETSLVMMINYRGE